MINEAEIVKAIRKQNQMTFREMGARAGISPMSICNIEHRKHCVSLYLFQQILDAFDLELAIVKKGSVE